MEDIKILYEDDDFICLSKPAGVLVHRAGEHAPRSGERVLTDWLLERYPEVRSVGDDPVLRPGIVHRLDKDTSGILVVARNSDAFSYLKKLFQNHEVKKTYIALVFGVPVKRSDVIRAPIAIKNGSLKRTTRGKNLRLMKEAITGYRTIKQFTFGEREFALLSVTPETGRTHQIRVHLSSIGNPVVGDKLYGASRERLSIAEELGITRQFLHSDTIEFTDRSGRRLSLGDALPPSLSRALDLLLPVQPGQLQGN